MTLPEGVILLDSLGDIRPENTSPILVCGSHCGGNRKLAQQVNKCHIKAVFLNNAGVGKNQAGTRGLPHYNAENVIACAVDCHSAEIGIAQDTWASGIISHQNELASAAGILIGDSVQEAVTKLKHLKAAANNTAADDSTPNTENQDNKTQLKVQSQTEVEGVKLTVTDSITFLNKDNAGHIVACGSHGGQSAGHYAMKHRVKAVFFNDAGIGKNQAGTKSLPALDNEGILACTVDCMSAEIFNGLDVLNNGIISACNALASAKHITTGMRVRDAVKLI